MKDSKELNGLNSLIFSSPIRLLVMIILLKNEELTIKDLTDLTNTTHGNLDHHIKQLEEANYLTKFPKGQNKRIVYAVRLTSAGKDIILGQLGNLKKVISDYDL